MGDLSQKMLRDLSSEESEKDNSFLGLSSKGGEGEEREPSRGGRSTSDKEGIDKEGAKGEGT